MEEQDRQSKRLVRAGKKVTAYGGAEERDEEGGGGGKYQGRSISGK